MKKFLLIAFLLSGAMVFAADDLSKQATAFYSDNNYQKTMDLILQRNLQKEMHQMKFMIWLLGWVNYCGDGLSMKKFKFLIRLSYFIVLLEIFYYLKIAPQVIGTHFVNNNLPDSFALLLKEALYG